jgi:thiamine biosynthesis lipoprotein
MRRRRFLQIAAAALVAPGRSVAETRWQGRALGADVSVSLSGDPAATGAILPRMEALLRGIEAEFSLHDPGSALSHLNRDGRLTPSPDFRALVVASDEVHNLTGGRFDPTVQPLWRALAEGRPADPARTALGWDRVRVSARMIRLAPGQALTFNGIAQGYATDRVRDLLAEAGFAHALINIGEYAAIGGPFRLGIEDPTAGLLGHRTLSGTAIATSSPGALSLGHQAHILDPKGAAPRWSSVSVEADTATLADGLSTGLCFLDRDEIAALIRRRPDIRSVMLVSSEGDLIRL